MVPTPMRRGQNALVILATFLVAGSLLPWSPRLRLACVAGVIGIVLLLFVGRLRAHAGAAQTRVNGEVQARIDRIRAARADRMGPRR
jgi:hypothetical protein